MKSKACLQESDVSAMLAAAKAFATQKGWAVTIAIVDEGGHLLGMLRLDGAPPISAHIAPAKAQTSAVGRRESKVYEDIINKGRIAFLSAPLVQGLLEGGVPIVVAGDVIGAVGVSGVQSFEDAEVAQAAIAALGV
jgi:glc operon protein GlcG